MKKIALLIVSVLFLCSCELEDSGNDNEIIVDPPTYGSVAIWKETEIKYGDKTSVYIIDGNKLSLFSNDSVIPKTGEYRYKESNYFTDIDSVGYFIQKEDLLCFISKQDSLASESLYWLEDVSGQAKVVKYEINDDILIIQDTLANPSFKIKFEMYRH